MLTMARVALCTATAAALRPVARRSLGPGALGLATGLLSTSATAADFAKTGSGLQYLDLKEGTGATPQVGNKVQVHYNGWLDGFGDHGRKFDSSLDRGRPLSFDVGTGKVIKGWDEALLTMKVGGKRRVIIPPELGYGSKGIGPIPGGATLYFEMNLMAIQ
jgi:peptidylprolyl isomerase